MKKILLANGDSWTFGSEIMAPEFLAKPGEPGDGMGNRFKPGYNDWSRYNDYYRIPRTWPTYLGNLLNIPEIINIARPARSNDTIYESTISWILENYIIKNKDISDLLVILGWTSPERKNIILTDAGLAENLTTMFTLWPAMQETKYYESPVMREFFKFYVQHCWVEQEYLKRFVEQNYNLQLFCKVHKIDYYVFNSFYSPHIPTGFENWKDISISDNINSWKSLNNGWFDPFYTWNTIKESLLTQWKYIEPNRYVNKDIIGGSFKGHIEKYVDTSIRLCGIHPSPESHKEWAMFLANHISKNNNE